MSETNPTNSELAQKVVGAVGAVQDAHVALVEGVVKLAAHNTDPDAHGLKNKSGPLYDAIQEIADRSMKWGLALPGAFPTDPDEIAAISAQLPIGGTVSSEAAIGGISLDEYAARLAELEKRGLYNTEEVITESGEYVVPVTGWFRLTLYQGGRGGLIVTSIGRVIGGYGYGPLVEYKFLTKGEIIPVTIGAGGVGLITDNEFDDTSVDGGATSFGDIHYKTYTTLIYSSICELNAAHTILKSPGGGYGGGSPYKENDEIHGRHWGAGGSAQWKQSGQNFVGNGCQGCVIVEYHDPNK